MVINVDHPLPPWRAWAAVMSIAGATFLLVTSEFLPIGLLGQMAADLGVSDGVMGLAVTLPGIVAAVTAPVLAMSAGALDRRPVLWVMTLLIVLSNVVVAFSSDIVTFLAGRVLLGVGVGGLWTFSVAAGRAIVPESAGARATSIIAAGIAIGTVAGVPAGVLVSEAAGWKAAFLSTGGFGAFVLLAQVFLLPSIPARSRPGFEAVFGILAVPRARLGLAAILLIAAGHFAAYTYLEPWLGAVPGLTGQQLTAALLIYGAAGVAGTFAGEAAASRSVRAAMAGVAALLGGAVLIAGGLEPTVPGAMAIVAVWGLAFGAVPVCVQLWMYQADPIRFEGSSALMVCVFQIALAAGSFAGGRIVDTYGVDRAMIVGGALAAAAAVLVALPARKTRPQRLNRFG